MNVQVKYTYRDLLTTPDDGNRYEIIQGELVMTPSPNDAHQTAHANLFGMLWSFVKKHSLGKLYSAPFAVYFDEGTVVEPDILFVSRDRLDRIDERKLNGPPDFVIEIISDSTESRDRSFKFTSYAREGVKQYWIVDPSKKTVEICKLERTGFILTGKFDGKEDIHSPLFEGLSFPAESIFQ